MDFCGISVSCVIYSTLYNAIIIQTSLKILRLRRNNIRRVDECKQTFLEENSCHILHVSAGEGRSRSRHSVSTDMFWWPHTHTHTHTHTVSACSFSFWAWLRCEVTLNRKKQLSKLNYRVFCLLLFELLNLLVWLECLSLEHCSCLRIWNQCLLNNRSMMLEKSLINNMFSFLHECMTNGCEMSYLSLITLFKYIFFLL